MVDPDFESRYMLAKQDDSFRRSTACLRIFALVFNLSLLLALIAVLRACAN